MRLLRPHRSSHPRAHRLARLIGAAIAAAVLAGCAGLQPPPTPQPPPPERREPAESASAPAPEARLPEAAPSAARLRPPQLPSGSLAPIEPAVTYALPVASLTPPADLWDRIRRGFAMPDLDDELSRERTEWYAARSNRVVRVMERSRKYLFHIVEELERRDMPLELALLPFVESAFNPRAISSAKAVGMWQFMPSTGKDFELKQNLFRDDRRDVLASTRAALDYLQKLYNMFGDWHLALAAYNWGQGSVKKAIERNQKKGLPTGYLDLTLPPETRHYVPKLQAIKNLVANPAQWGIRLPAIGNHPFFDTVPIERDIDVALAARLAELDEADFRELNPSVHQPIILAAGTPQILLPWENAAIFKRNLAYHIGPLASWTAWAVPSSMRTSEIAKRFNMPESDLRSLNKIPPGMLVKAGSTVLVPRLGVVAEQEVPEHLADHAQLSLQPERVSVRRKIQARKGDTLLSLAKRHDVSVADLARWNKLPLAAALKPGQTLILWTDTPGAQSPARNARASAPATSVRAAPRATRPTAARNRAKAASTRSTAAAPRPRKAASSTRR